MSAAIYYYPEAYAATGARVMGRNAAGASFLQGFAAHGRADALWTLVEKPAHARLFIAAMQAHGCMKPVHAVDKTRLGRLMQPGTVYFPAPDIGKHARHRAAFGPNAWSLCGVTHTIFSGRAMDALTDLLVAPVQPWDAIICTSTAVKASVERLLQAESTVLQERLGATRFVLPQLPVIPLGINAADFAGTAAKRLAARQALGIDADAIVVLFLGRLSFHAKANPLPQYLALERAARITGRKLVLVECGQFASAGIAQAFRDAAQCLCPGVRVIALDSVLAEDRARAWAAADIFSSLSDNLQESFGLTPLEAMAAGLPLVVSDWNGYKDTVRDQVDGFRVPTLMPQAGLGADLALRHALGVDNYDRYCGFTSLLVAVDVDAATAAFVRLIEDPQLRQSMGEAGRRRVREHFDWSVIIPRYEALWCELAELRKHAPMGKRPAHPWPARMEPFHAFAGYPTHTLTLATRLRLADGDAGIALQRTLAYRQLALIEFGVAILPTEEEIGAVLAAAGTGTHAAGELIATLAEGRRPLVLRGLAWLVKLGVLQVCKRAAS